MEKERMEKETGQVVVGYYMSPDGQVIPLMADAKYYPDGVPEIPLLMPQAGSVQKAMQQNLLLTEQQNLQPSVRHNPVPAALQTPQPAAQQNPLSSAVGTDSAYRTQPKAEKKEKSLENVVGRNLMGILASLLIFIGMILLATAAYKAFSNAARVVFIYALSGVLLAVGLTGMNKKRNAFYLSLAGCGAGAVYISLFLTYGYFRLINGPVLYLLLALWSFAVFFLGGKGSLLFKTIGQGGVLVSAFYGTVMQFMEMKSPDLLSFTLVLMFYYIVVTVFYLLMDSARGNQANLPALIMDFIGAMILTAAAFHVSSVIPLTAQVALTGVILVYTLFLLFLYRRRITVREMSGVDSLCWVIAVFVQAVFALLAIFLLIPKGAQDLKWLRGCIAMAQYAALWWLTEYKARRDSGRRAALTVIFLFFWICSDAFGVLSEILGIGFFALLFLTWGFFKKDRLYFAFGCAGSILYVLFYGKYPAVYCLIAILLGLLILFFQLYGGWIYHLSFKLSAYAVLQIVLFRMIGFLASYTVLPRAVWINTAYLISAVLCIAATHSPFCREWTGSGQKERSTQIALGIWNIILMLWSCLVLNLMNSGIFHILTLLAYLALCIQNIMPMVRHYGKSLGVGLYTGLKLTVFVHLALHSYQLESYAVTLACLFLALAFITFGFLRNYKPIRLYGLILSLYSIFKLVMADVTYRSTLSRALTILGCGAMAFMISFVYNKISRKLEEAEEGKPAHADVMPERHDGTCG